VYLTQFFVWDESAGDIGHHYQQVDWRVKIKIHYIRAACSARVRPISGYILSDRQDRNATSISMFVCLRELYCYPWYGRSLRACVRNALRDCVGLTGPGDSAKINTHCCAIVEGSQVTYRIISE
jgi:hypothetical protein